MNQNHSHQAHNKCQPQNRTNRQTQLRSDADEMLREIAFVLKMTQRVRQEIDAEQEAQEPVLV